MSSVKKQRKLKNAHLLNSGLKATSKCRRVHFYTSSLRHKLDKDLCIQHQQDLI